MPLERAAAVQAKLQAVTGDGKHADLAKAICVARSFRPA